MSADTSSAAESSRTAMFGSVKQCPSCSSFVFTRVLHGRAVQCARCAMVVEEPARSYLAEYHAMSTVEEIHCAVTPDMRAEHLVLPDLPEDPYCTPGFITAFRMLSPLREPIYAASAASISGALAELERQIGECIYDSYVGYNGRASMPSVSDTNSLYDSKRIEPSRPRDLNSTLVKGDSNNETNVDSTANSGDNRNSFTNTHKTITADEDGRQPLGDRTHRFNASNLANNTDSNSTPNNDNNTNYHINSTNSNIDAHPSNNCNAGSDARHTLVAYFEILDLANILDVDRETANLALRIFRFAATTTSLRNRNVEALAAASLCIALDRRHADRSRWMASNLSTHKDVSNDDDAADSVHTTEYPAMEPNFDPASVQPHPLSLSVAQVSEAADLEHSDVQRYLKLISSALGKNGSDSSSTLSGKIPAFCDSLQLDQDTKALAVAIADNAFRFDVCPRRNPSSVSAAAIYMACQLREIRKTQTEICRVMEVTEVTLRKVHKELMAAHDQVIPSYFPLSSSSPSRSVLHAPRTQSLTQASHASSMDAYPRNSSRQRSFQNAAPRPASMSSVPSNSAGVLRSQKDLLTARNRESSGDADGTVRAKGSEGDCIDMTSHRQDRSANNDDLLDCSLRADSGISSPKIITEQTPTGSSGLPTELAQQFQQQQQQIMLAMLQNPAMMQAVAGAMAMIPSFVAPPPPPPPLPNQVKETCIDDVPDQSLPSRDNGTKNVNQSEHAMSQSDDEPMASLGVAANDPPRAALSAQPIEQIQAGLQAMQAMFSCFMGQSTPTQRPGDDGHVAEPKSDRRSPCASHHDPSKNMSQPDSDTAVQTSSGKLAEAPNRLDAPEQAQKPGNEMENSDADCH